ncbi:MAG TPA: aldehyde dehydrogenase, partial [Corynebacterium sp.]|nr:aldehyde dehydrogenase [Corynebacterium sp.]
MTTQLPDTTLDDSVDKVVAQARAWLAATEGEQDEAAQLLGQLMQDPAGVDFTMDFVDRVARPEDDRTAARALQKMPVPPGFLSRVDRLLLSAGTRLAGALPAVVMPAARKRLRQLVGHLVLDAEGPALNSLLDKAAEQGQELNLNLLGEAVLGAAEATDRARRTRELIENPRVTYVSVKATSLCAQLNPWDVDGNVARLKEQLRPLYQAAARQRPRVFLNLDM